MAICAAERTGKETIIDIVPKKFVLLQYLWSVRKACILKGLRAHGIKMSINNREGE